MVRASKMGHAQLLSMSHHLGMRSFAFASAYAILLR